MKKCLVVGLLIFLSSEVGLVLSGLLLSTGKLSVSVTFSTPEIVALYRLDTELPTAAKVLFLSPFSVCTSSWRFGEVVLAPRIIRLRSLIGLARFDAACIELNPI